MKKQSSPVALARLLLLQESSVDLPRCRAEETVFLWLVASRRPPGGPPHVVATCGATCGLAAYYLWRHLYPPGGIWIELVATCGLQRGLPWIFHVAGRMTNQ
jgi:hypothetical protein